MSIGVGAEDGERAPAALAGHLGYLLKHAWLRAQEVTGPALAPYGIGGRELAVLLVLADGESPSQQQAAGRLEVDRTTMVALLDELEAKGLVARRPHPEDRRRNIVELTEKGRETLGAATRAYRDAERRFLAPLGEAGAERLKEALRVLVAGEVSGPPRAAAAAPPRSAGRPR
jgi:DNA-binding MarR family transcriptional regulator